LNATARITLALVLRIRHAHPELGKQLVVDAFPRTNMGRGLLDYFRRLSAREQLDVVNVGYVPKRLRERGQAGGELSQSIESNASIR
jgi:hypothetical protein